MKRFVYLAGPILNCTKGEANDWRTYVDDKLQPHNIVGISPLRCEPLIGERYTAIYEDPRFGTSRAIGAKNKFDVKTCDMTLAYLPKKPFDAVENWHQSWGTMGEIFWADAYDRLVVCVTDDPEVAKHPVINACCPWLLNNLDDAIDTAIGILGGYAGGKNI